MVWVTIDGIEVRVAEGSNLVEAASKAGIEIPTYCYHPGLTVVGQCRICFVEIEGMPRLVTACSTPVQDGMVVLTNSDRVREARAAVMEFLLENHPLDCPVCDQAGECGLQDYSVEHGLDTTNMVDDRRRYPGLERRQIGPHVIQNQNRCIHCTRCIRFTEEISETADLTMKARGNHSYIDTFDGQPLENPWSACVADVCPVGALTVKEFRFRARVWHLQDTDSLCPGCSIGCNIRLGHLDGVVHRFKPRLNREINGWWMCDYGRFLAEDIGDRDLDQPLVNEADSKTPTNWSDSISRLATILKNEPKALVVASANFSNGALFLVKKALVEGAGLEVVVPVHRGNTRRIKNSHGEWISSEDAHPNSSGARRIGLTMADAAGLESFVRECQGPLVILDADAHPWLCTQAAALAVGKRQLIVAGRRKTPLTDVASLVLPLASWAETEGSYTSSTGRVQLAQKALPPKGQARPAWEILHRLAVELGVIDDRAVTPRTLFAELVAEVPAFAGMTFRRLATEPGMPIHEEVTRVG